MKDEVIKLIDAEMTTLDKVTKSLCPDEGYATSARFAYWVLAELRKKVEALP